MASTRYSTAYRRLPWNERFHRCYIKVDGPLNDQCWIWTSHRGGHKDPKFRYGTLVVNKKRRLAHRLSWELFTGEPPDPTKVICHRCDRPLCVNPGHLFIGTRKDNNKDRDDKGRGPRGERNWCTKLKEKDIPKIRQLRKEGLKQPEIARMFNVNPGTISRIISGNAWKHIKGEQ